MPPGNGQWRPGGPSQLPQRPSGKWGGAPAAPASSGLIRGLLNNHTAGEARPPSGPPPGPGKIRPVGTSVPGKIQPSVAGTIRPGGVKSATGGVLSGRGAEPKASGGKLLPPAKAAPAQLKRPQGDAASSSGGPQKAARVANGAWWQEDASADGNWSPAEQKAWWQEQQANKKAEIELQKQRMEENREEKRLSAQKREKMQVSMKKLNDKVTAEDIDEAIVVTREMKDADLRPPPAVLQRLLELAAKRGSQSEFARALVVSSECGMKVSTEVFVKMIMAMVQRGCPQIMLRIALNMPLAPEAPVVPLLPPQMDDEDEHQVFEDGEPLPIDAKEEKEAKKDAKKAAKEAPPVSEHPLALILCGVDARPELNGPYEFTDSFAEYLEHDRPTYRKGASEFYAYYWHTEEEGEECGWCLGYEVGGEEMLGFNKDTKSWVPPKTGWTFMRAGAKECTKEEGGFVPPEEAPKEAEDPWPAELTFCGGQPDEAVSGTYKKTSGVANKNNNRPVYVKAGVDQPTLYTYFWIDDPDKPWKSGWWIGQEVGGDLVCGYNPEQSWVPPCQGWQINRFDDDGQCQRRPHPGGFYHQPPTETAQDDDRFKSLEEVVRKIDLKSLHGMVQFPDSRAQAYFGHFCVLLHLEYLKELAQVRRRLNKSTRDQLVQRGWALDGLSVRAIFGQKWKGRFGGLPGKASSGNEQVAFGLPKEFDQERCRIRRGDSIMVSPANCDDPLKEKIGEGVVNDINDWEIVLAIDGHLPEDARKRQWRIDKSANHTAHERQLLALLKLARSGTEKGPPKIGGAINSLLMAAPVGLVDEWAVQMKEKVDEMQAEKLKEKGLEAPEDTEDAWEKWLSTDSGGYVNTKKAIDDEITKAQTAVKGKGVPKGGQEDKTGNTDEAMTIAQLAAQGPPIDEDKLHGARRALGRAKDLNASQRRAVNAALGRRCTVIQGPPGTGKTHVSVKILSIMARELGLKPLLAASDSNVAVDNICGGLIADGIKAIRVGRPEKVRSHLEDITLEAQLKKKKAALQKEAYEAEQRVKQAEAEAEVRRLAAEAEKKAKAQEAELKKLVALKDKQERLEAAKRKVEEAKAADAAEKAAKKEKEEAEKAAKKADEGQKEEEEAEEAKEEPSPKRLKTEEPQAPVIAVVVPAAPAAPVCCPAGHALEAYDSPEGTTATCDKCGEDSEMGAQLFGCRVCDYDACAACADSKAEDSSDKDKSEEPAAKRVKTEDPESAAEAQSPKPAAKPSLLKPSAKGAAKKSPTASDAGEAETEGVKKELETPKSPEKKAGWVSRLLQSAQISEHLEKATEWIEENGCVLSDLREDDGAEELIEHLKLKKFAANRLKKAIAALEDEPATPAVKEECKEEEKKEESDAEEVKKEELTVAKEEPIDEAQQEALDLLEQERKEREEAIQAKKDRLGKAAADQEKKLADFAKAEAESKAAALAKVELQKKGAEKAKELQAERAKKAAEEAKAKAEKSKKAMDDAKAKAEKSKKVTEDAKAKVEKKEEIADDKEEEAKASDAEEEKDDADKDAEADEEKSDTEKAAEDAAAELVAAKEEAQRLVAEAKATEKAIIARQDVRKKQRMEDWELQMELLKECEVICTTTISAGSNFLDSFQFEAILIDEAAQATELSTIVPVVLRGTNRLIIVGDHCQLPPSIMSLEAETRGLSVSIYSRLVGVGIEPHFLNTQYRSHPKIAEFSASAFYGGLLKSGTTAAGRPAPKGFEWPNPDCPICFVEVPERERREGDTKINPAEAARVIEIVKNVLMNGELNINDVGVVTPYMGQVRLLRKDLRQVLPNLLRRLYQQDWNGPWQNYDPKFLEIGSVDAYQGREKELIVFSAVRSNSHGNLGFLGDWRRLNVMLTRAKRGLIVIGHADTLKHDPCWQQWLQWCGENKCILNFSKAGSGAGVLLPGSASQEEFSQRLGAKGSKGGKGGWQGGQAWQKGGDKDKGAMGKDKGNSWGKDKSQSDNSWSKGKNQDKGKAKDQKGGAQNKGKAKNGKQLPEQF